MLERIMLDIMYDVPSREDIAEVTINRAVVEGKKLPLVRKKQDKDAAFEGFRQRSTLNVTSA